MTRFRLRFLLQEFDLAGPEVTMGRSPDCHVTIEDPLVSRKHARIVIEDGNAAIEDTGSRNGVRINGRRIDRPTRLRDGDRIRLGTQELVFQASRGRARVARTTGFLRTCSACGTPYPEQAAVCPHCGHEGRDETMSGVKLDAPRRWMFQLLIEVAERGLDAGNVQEAERILVRAANEVAERAELGERLDPEHVEALALLALRLAEDPLRGRWVSWALSLHRNHALFPSSVVIDRMERLSFEELPDQVRELERFHLWLEESGVRRVANPDDETRIAQLVETASRTGTGA